MTVRVMGQWHQVTAVQFTGTDSAMVFYLDEKTTRADGSPVPPLIRWIQMSIGEFHATVSMSTHKE